MQNALVLIYSNTLSQYPVRDCPTQQGKFQIFNKFPG